MSIKKRKGEKAKKRKGEKAKRRKSATCEAIKRRLTCFAFSLFRVHFGAFSLFRVASQREKAPQMC